MKPGIRRNGPGRAVLCGDCLLREGLRKPRRNKNMRGDGGLIEIGTKHTGASKRGPQSWKSAMLQLSSTLEEVASGSLFENYGTKPL
jgi:hypothetical protein